MFILELLGFIVAFLERNILIVFQLSSDKYVCVKIDGFISKISDLTVSAYDGGRMLTS